MGGWGSALRVTGAPGIGEKYDEIGIQDPRETKKTKG